MSTDGAGDAPHPLVITMWETYGSNMEAVAVRVGEILSVPIHMQAYSSEDIERAQEERENEGALGRLVRLLAPVGSIQDVAWNPSGMDATYREMSRENTAVVWAEAEAGGVVMGRSGAYVLKDRPHTLHVKLDGATEKRVARAAELSGISLARANKRQRIEDEFRAETSLRTYYWDPRGVDNYDLVVNTGLQETEESAQFIAAAARIRGARAR